MKKTALIIVLLALGAGAYFYLQQPSEPEFVLEDGYTLLYNGKSLDGWRAVGGEATFTAQGESIVGRHGPGKNTFLRTEETFGDFSLRMQVRWDEFGNSGVMFRGQQRDESDDTEAEGGRVYGYQYELDPAERSWSGGIYDEARRGWLASLEDNPAAREAIRRDDWNDVEIEARGTRLKTWINGVPAADIIDGLDAQGFIALQVHAGDAGVLRWRHIRIRQLPGQAIPGDSLLNAAQWRKAPANLTFSDSSLGGEPTEGAQWLASRRQFTDVMVTMTVPACDQPTIVQMRYRPDETGSSTSFAEVKIFADRAEARLVGRSGVQVMDPVLLRPGDVHRFVGITHGGAVVFSVDESDAMRIPVADIAERGQLRIAPAHCGDRYRVDDLAWFSLKEQSDEKLFYQTLDNAPAPVLTPEEALDAFKIAPGFEIELVAAEPLVEDPVAIAWDEYGRLYAVEMRSYMPDAYGSGSSEPVGQVVRLEDSDGDGRMDRSEVFLGELVNPRAVAVVNDGVLIGEPPNLWLCEVPERDALCTNKRSIGEYGADVGAANVEHMENGLRQNLDNWLYNSKSSRRLRVVDGDLIAEEGFFRGQWGITHDKYGRLLYNHNSTWIQADLFQAEDLVTPDLSLRPHGLGENLTKNPEVFSVRVNPGVNRAYLDSTLRPDGRLKNATGASGLVAYRGDQFPEEYANDVFVPEAAGNVVAQFALTENGMELEASQRLYDDAQWGQRGFLGSTDERFRPVDAMNGPDGALYIIDMYRGIIQDDHFLTDELRDQIFQRQLETPLGMGRIWRVRHSEGKADGTPVVLAGATGSELVAALAHPNGWVRDTAQRLLLARAENLRQELEAVATGDNILAALHAIWALQGRDELRATVVLRLLLGEDKSLSAAHNAQRRVHALRAGAALLNNEQLIALVKPLRDASEAEIMQLAFSMTGRSDDGRVRQALLQLLEGQGQSAYVRQAIVRAVRGSEIAFLEDMFASVQLAQDSAGRSATLRALGANAYRALRGDVTSTEPANPQLLELLALVQSREKEAAWQQVALLTGFADVAREDSFTPAQLAAVPPLFADGSVGEDNPLWKARLSGRTAFTWPGDELALGIKPLSPEQLKLAEKGRAFFTQCAACHGEDGKGVTGLAPALAGASWVIGPPEWLGRIILQGMSGPVEINGEVFDGVMPPHGHLAELDDATLAGLMTHIRRSWGNKAEPVSIEKAAQVRADSASRTRPWTVTELEAVPYETDYARFVGKYSVSFITMTVEEKPDGLYFSVPLYGSGKLQPLNENTFKAETGSESVLIEFTEAADGSIEEIIMLRKGERLKVKRKE